MTVDEIGDTVRVDRSVRPTYPDSVQMVKHPELEATGPAEYDLSALTEWLHESHRAGQRARLAIEMECVYERLKKGNMLARCLGLADLEAIQKLGIVVFHKHFAGKTVIGWKSVVLDHRLYVPLLVTHDDGVYLRWDWLGSPSTYFPAFLFES